MTYHFDVDLGHLAEIVLLDFSTVNLGFFTFHTLFFGNKSLSPTHTFPQGEGQSRKEDYLHIFGIFFFV